MEAIYLEPTFNTPKVIFDEKKRVLLLEGESRPENPKQFYDKLINWIESYNNLLYYSINERHIEKPDITLNCKFTYLNSISIKYFFDLLKKLETLASNCNSLVVNWYYVNGDTEMKENGLDYADMVNLKINTIPA